MKKIVIRGNPITPHGSFDNGQVLGDDKYPEQFLQHLVDAGAGDWLKYNTKVDDEYEAKKKGQSSQSLQQEPASPKKTRGRPKTKAK